MKKYIGIIVVLITTVLLSSCIEDTYKTLYKGSVVEFDAAVWNTNALSVTYPILTRVPPVNRAVPTTAPTISRTTGTVNLRINLVSAPYATDQTIDVNVVVTGTTAVENTHFTVPATVVILAGESFGTLAVTILDPGATTGTVDLILELGGNEKLEPSENYKRIGLRIAQS